MALPAHSWPWPLIQFRNHFSQTVGLLGRVISPSQGRYLNTGQHRHGINLYTHQISMAWLGFEPTITAPEQLKTVHALDRPTIVSGHKQFHRLIIQDCALLCCWSIVLFHVISLWFTVMPCISRPQEKTKNCGQHCWVTLTSLVHNQMKI
jgi:hypothetical protein